MKNRILLPVLFFSILAVILTVSCSNTLIGTKQNGLSVVIKTENQALGRNAVETKEWKVEAWIEHRDNTISHKQEHSADSNEKTTLTFNELEIGKNVRIAVKLTANDDSQRTFSGKSEWTTITAGPSVIVIIVTEDKESGGTPEVDPEEEEPEVEKTLTGITASYAANRYHLQGSTIDLGKITINQTFSDGTTTPVIASTVSNDYTISYDNTNSIGHVPATITHKTMQKIRAELTIPVKYRLYDSLLTIEGNTTVIQNEELPLTAKYQSDGNDVSYTFYESKDSSNSYKVIEKVSISWTGVTLVNDTPWEANAETNNTGNKTATVKLSTKDDWCITTDGIEKTHPYEVTAPIVTASIGDIVYLDNSVSTTLDNTKTPVGIVVSLTSDNKPSLILALNDVKNTDVNYDEAQSACSSGTIDGKTWRIPTLNEWKEVIKPVFEDIQAALPAAGGSAMDKKGMYFYWTKEKNRIVLTNFNDVSGNGTEDTTRARLVRNWQ